LRRLVGALLDNALKYTERGGDVNLRLEETRDGLDLEITDTGCGIPQDSLHRVFDRFYRVDSSRDRETGGYGLGLSIAQQIARSHLGRLEVSSVLNQGSSFRLHLPKNGIRPS
jgi:signal transduction histidine kinase